MTLERRRRRNSDIFDTGPLSGYKSLGNGAEVDSEGIEEYYNGFYYSYNSTNWSVYDSAMTLLETGSDASGSYGNYQAARNWIDSGADPTYPVSDPFDDTGSTTQFNWLTVLSKDEIHYETWKDAYYAQSVLGIITVNEAKTILREKFQWNNQTLNYYNMLGTSMSDYDPEPFIAQFNNVREQELGSNYNPQIPVSDYEAGEYLLPNVGNATAAGQKIPTNTSYEYWDGDIANHDWAKHGSSTPIVTGGDGGRYAKPIVDSFGGYAMSLSHYIASYGSNGEFLGFRVLSASELEGGIPAGIPMATVIQMFTKCVKSRNGVDFSKSDTFNFVLDTEKQPIWRKALDMPMEPKSFFFVDEELGAESKLSIPQGGLDNVIVMQTKLPSPISHYFSVNDFKSNFSMGYGVDPTDGQSRQNVVPSLFTNSQFSEGGPRAKTLNREFRESKWLQEGLFTQGAGGRSKVHYAVKMEWLGENGQFGSYSTHPTSIPACDSQGKTMVVYRFPRQLDAELDKELLRFYAQNGMPNYEITTTGKCYPMPGLTKSGTLAEKDRYGLIGRLAPTSSDSLDSEFYETEYAGETYAGRRKINLIPMVSPNLPPSNRHRPYIVSQSGPSVTLNDSAILAATDWFCFDTSKDHFGAKLSVTDPYKKAFLGSGRLTNAYFPKADLDVGSSAFAIGQCMLAYDMSKPSVDSRMGENYVNLPHSSERVILTTETQRMDSVRMRQLYGDAFTSDELTPRPTRDGSAAATYKSDYLPPLQIITTDDLILMENPPEGYIEPVGMGPIREAWNKTFGTELSSAAFAALPNIGANDNPNRYGRRDPNNPLRYTISTGYGSFSYPFSIAIFNIPPHFRGPVLKYTDEVNAQGNLIPMEATQMKPGYIGTKSVRMVYQTPFGEVNSSQINLDKQIQRQIDVIDDGGSVEDIFDEQTQEGGIDEGQYTEDEQEIFTERQFENWIYERLMEDYGNVRFTDTASKAYFKWWNKDYVTGKMLLEAGFPIPGVDLAPYYAEAESSGIPIASQITPTEEQDAQTANTSLPSSGLAGLGAFSDSRGFTVTDVTSKWGAMGSASPRYTGDLGMSMVPYKANIQDEQLGYLAISNLDGVENIGSSPDQLGNVIDDYGTAIKYVGAGVGGGFAMAGIGVAGAAILVGSVAAVNMIAARKSAEKLAERLVD